MSKKITRRTFTKATAAATLGLTAAQVAGVLGTGVARAEGAKKVFRAGAFAVDITPRKLPVIVNGHMRERIVTNVVDPLHARCLVLDDGAAQIAIVVVDSCMAPRSLLDKAKELAATATGILPEKMLISATHTHSAPSVCAILGSGQEDEYGEFLAVQIAKGIEVAYKNLTPARIGWAVGKDPKNVFCRRYLMKPGAARTCRFTGHENDQAQMNPGHLNPNAVKRTGPVDTDVPVLSVQAFDGRPIALLGNYSTHYAGAPPLSADYFGVFCRLIREHIGAGEVAPPFVGMLSNGTSGDANCLDFNHAGRKFDRFTVAQDVAQAAQAAYKGIKYYDWVPLVTEEKLLTLEVRMPNVEEVAEAKAYIAENFKDRKPCTVTEVYARETVILDQMPPTRELKLQAIRIGELGITAIPNEVYGCTGLAIKQKSPLKPTFNISLANGCEGYIPPPEQHELGGYTTWRARSSCLEVQAEPKIRTVVLELLNKVARQRSNEPSVL